MDLQALLGRARRPLGLARRRWRRTAKPIGSVATDRRLIRAQCAALGNHVLVIGDPLAVDQALPATSVDVLGTQPYERRVTVLSDGLGAGSLPTRRWTGVIVLDPPADRLMTLLDAAIPACRVGGSVIVIAGRPPRPRTLTTYPVR